MALGLAHLLNYRLRGSTFFRVAVLTPYATSVAAATLVFVLLFGRDYGMINWALGLVGIDTVDWQNGKWASQIAVSTIVIWRWTGYNALIYLAAMQADPAATCTSRRRSTGPRAGSSSSTSRCPRCGRRSCSPSSSPRSARPSSSASRCCSTAARAPPAAPTTSSRRSACYLYEQGWVNLHLGRASAIAWAMFLILLRDRRGQLRCSRRRLTQRAP